MTPPPHFFPAGLQTQPSNPRLYNGPWDAARKIWAQRGLAGIFKGQVATFGRESLGYASYFLCYETLMQREMSAKGIRREEVHASHAVLYGAAAGYGVSAPLLVRG
jgi:solute carrier family 25 carnitine/acylcarnitine transporter 20/29